MSVKRNGLILTFLWAASAAWAQTPVSLQSLYQQSLSYYPSEKNITLDQHIAQNAIGSARSQWLPRLDISATGVDSDNDDSDYREAKASIRQALYNRSALYQMDEAEQGLKAAHWQTIEHRQSLLIEIAEQYTQALIQTEQAKLAEQSLKESQTLLRITKKAVELEQKPLLDLLRAQADASEKQADWIEAQNLETDALAQLKRYVPKHTTVLNLQPFNPATFASPSNGANQSAPHPSLARLEHETQQAQQATQRTRSAYYPNADVSWELSERHTHSQIDSKDIAVTESRITLSVNWNLFQGLSTAYAVDSAQHQVSKKINEQHLAQLNLTKDINKTHALIDSTQQSLNALEKVLSARHKAVETVEKSWTLNLVDVSEVQAEHSALQQAKLDHYTQQRTLALEQLRLLLFKGTLTRE